MAENKGLLIEIELKDRLDEYWNLYCELWNDGVIDESDYESGFDYWALEAQHDKTLAKIREVVEGAGLTGRNPYNPKNSVLEKHLYDVWEAGAKAQLQAILKALDNGGK